VTGFSSPDPQAEANRAYAAAIRLLGNRDHSSAELTRKLGQRGFDEEVIVATLGTLSDANYVDDRRYACMLAEQMAGKRRGPLAIRAKLRERGIDGEAAEAALAALNVDWVERAASALRTRFDVGSITESDQKMRAKVARFLQGRGFSSSDSLKALQSVARDAVD